MNRIDSSEKQITTTKINEIMKMLYIFSNFLLLVLWYLFIVAEEKQNSRVNHKND